MTPSVKKRFWTDALVNRVDCGFQVLLDKHVLTTPAGMTLVVPTLTLATAIAAEWQAQGSKIVPATMPMSRRANAAIDKVTVQHAEVAELLAAYGDSDLICYRAKYPAGLVDLQAEAWDPLLAWAKSEFQVDLQVSQGVMHRAQQARDLARLARPVHALPSFPLTGFHDLVTLSGSLIIALAAILGYAAAEQLWQCSQIDETWQADHWGTDTEANESTARKKRDFLAGFRFFELSKST